MMAKRKVPFVNLPKQYKEIGKEVNIAIEKVLKNGRYILGSEVEKLESELSKFIGTKYAIGVASGTDALTIALKSLDLGKGDDVVVPANAYPTAFGVSLSGAKVKSSADIWLTQWPHLANNSDDENPDNGKPEFWGAVL